MDVFIPTKQHRGTCYIVGGGPSLKGVELSPLPFPSIGVNLSYRKVISPYQLIGDQEFFRQVPEAVLELKSFPKTHRVCVISLSWPSIHALKCKYMRKERCIGFSKTPDSLCWHLPGIDSGNTGAAAVNLAQRLGFEKIILLGFDMNIIGEKNWHDAYSNKTSVEKINKHILQFEGLAKEAKILGIKILNANVDSAIPYFEKISLKEALKGG